MDEKLIKEALAWVPVEENRVRPKKLWDVIMQLPYEKEG